MAYYKKLEVGTCLRVPPPPPKKKWRRNPSKIQTFIIVKVIVERFKIEYKK